MSRMKRVSILPAAVTVVFVLLLVGCRSGRQWINAGRGPTYVTPTQTVPAAVVVRRAPAVKGSGFLGNYAKLRPHPTERGAHHWRKPGLDLRVYDALLIDPIEIVPTKGSTLEGLSDEVKQRAAEVFHEILMETIAPYYDVVDAPGEHVLRVRMALTDIAPADEVAEGDPRVSVGAAALEGELRDATTGEQLVAFLDRIEGSEEGRVVAEKWRPVEGAMRHWADLLLEFFDTWQPPAGK